MFCVTSFHRSVAIDVARDVRSHRTHTQRRRARPRLRAAARETLAEDDDAYEVLNVSRDASSEDVRKAYLKLSKTMHPDVRAASASDGAMTRVNAAYEALRDVNERLEYDRALKRRDEKNGKNKRNGMSNARSGSTVIYEGLVGPLRQSTVSNLEVCEVEACAIDIEETMVDSIRQWARTLAFTSEMPLPLPLSVDDVPNGARIAFMRFIDGGLREAGAILICVETDAETTRVAVRRSWTGEQKSFVPGEDRVLASFFEEFKFFIDEDNRRNVGERPSSALGDIGSAMMAFFLPAIPFFGAASSTAPGGAYSAYNLKRDAKYIDEEAA